MLRCGSTAIDEVDRLRRGGKPRAKIFTLGAAVRSIRTHPLIISLPPLLIQVGKSETMFGDAEAYASKVRQAGGEVEFEPYDDVPHGWHNSDHVVPDIPEPLAAESQIGIFLKNLCFRKQIQLD